METLGVFPSRLHRYIARIEGSSVHLSRCVRVRRWRSVFSGCRPVLREQPLARWQNMYRSPLVSLAWSPDERLLIVGGTLGEILAWNVERREPVLAVKKWPVEEPIRELVWDPTGTYFAARSAHYVQVWQCAGKMQCAAQIAVSAAQSTSLWWAADEDCLCLGRQILWQSPSPLAAYAAGGAIYPRVLRASRGAARRP